MKTLLLLTLTGAFVGIILTALSTYLFVHWNILSNVFTRVKLYSTSPMLAWVIELMVHTGDVTMAQRKMLCKYISTYCLKRMHAFKQALKLMNVEYKITAQPSHYLNGESLVDSRGNQRTMFITIFDTNKCFGIGFLIMISYLLIKELNMSSTFNNAPLNIVFCTAQMIKNGQYHD